MAPQVWLQTQILSQLPDKLTRALQSFQVDVVRKWVWGQIEESALEALSQTNQKSHQTVTTFFNFGLLKTQTLRLTKWAGMQKKNIARALVM